MDFLVRRENDLRRAIEALTNATEGIVWDVIGVHGIGKSVFFNQVRAEAEGLGAEVCILEVSMKHRGLGKEFRGDYGQNASANVLWETFVRSRELMIECADYLTNTSLSANFDTFKQVCQREGDQADRFIAAHDIRFESGSSGSTSVVDQAMKSRIRELQKNVDNEFLKAWQNFTMRRHVLVTLDSFDDLVDNELGHWVVRMALEWPNTLTMLARVPSTIKLTEGHPQLKQLFLSAFTVDQVDKYLAGRFVGEEPRRISELAEVVHVYTDGHPGGVDLAARLISEKDTDIDARALRRIFDRLPDDPEKRWATLVHLILDAVHDPVLRKAVDAASVTLSFDEPLLADLLGLDPHEEHGAGDALEALKAYRLTEPARDVGSESGRYRLHEFIRLSLADDFRVNHSRRWKLLHSRAAQHYFDLLQEDEAQVESGTYGQWFRYERPGWQAYKQQFLYHSGQLPERRELTRSRFVLVFLEAFWWWGCYQPFSFNPRLLEGWERAAAMWAGDSTKETKEDIIKNQQLADALWFLLNNYPEGHLKSATKRWEEMRSRLKLVQSLCGLSPGARLPTQPKERREMARARAMIKIFLAHTVRYRDSADPAADRYYREALRTFEKLKDDVVVSWLLFETADLALERGQAEEAVSLVTKSATRLLVSTPVDGEATGDSGEVDFDGAYDPDEEGADWDYELLANVHRVRADAHWMRGEVAEAAVEYGRAVADAYWFQGDPHPPDPYTHRFYGEITGRVAGRILALAESDDGRALQFTVDVRAQLPDAALKSDPAAVVLSGQVAEVCALLFPRGPQGDDELGPGTDDSPFMDSWRILEEHRTDPAKRLHEFIGDNGPQ